MHNDVKGGMIFVEWHVWHDLWNDKKCVFLLRLRQQRVIHCLAIAGNNNMQPLTLTVTNRKLSNPVADLWGQISKQGKAGKP